MIRRGRTSHAAASIKSNMYSNALTSGFMQELFYVERSYHYRS